MRIETEIKRKMDTPFGYIKAGDIFRFDDELYIKMDERAHDVTAVKLANGEGMEILPSTRVKPVDGKFVLLI